MGVNCPANNLLYKKSYTTIPGVKTCIADEIYLVKVIPTPLLTIHPYPSQITSRETTLHKGKILKTEPPSAVNINHQIPPSAGIMPTYPSHKYIHDVFSLFLDPPDGVKKFFDYVDDNVHWEVTGKYSFSGHWYTKKDYYDATWGKINTLLEEPGYTLEVPGGEKGRYSASCLSGCFRRAERLFFPQISQFLLTQPCFSLVSSIILLETAILTPRSSTRYYC